MAFTIVYNYCKIVLYIEILVTKEGERVESRSNKLKRRLDEIEYIYGMEEELGQEYFFYEEKIDRLEQNYEKYLKGKNRPYIVKQIEDEIQKRLLYSSKQELAMIANNFYEYTCLMYNNVPLEEVKQYFSYKRSYYYDIVKNCDKSINGIGLEKEDKIVDIISKYKNIIENDLKHK